MRQEASVGAGYYKSRGGWQSHNSLSAPLPTLLGPDGDIGAGVGVTAKAYVRFTLSVALYTSNLRVNFAFTPYLAVEAKPSAILCGNEDKSLQITPFWGVDFDVVIPPIYIDIAWYLPRFYLTNDPWILGEFQIVKPRFPWPSVCIATSLSSANAGTIVRTQIMQGTGQRDFVAHFGWANLTGVNCDSFESEPDCEAYFSVENCVTGAGGCQAMQYTNVIANQNYPVWDYEFKYFNADVDAYIRYELWDEDSLYDESLGFCASATLSANSSNCLGYVGCSRECGNKGYSMHEVLYHPLFIESEVQKLRSTQLAYYHVLIPNWANGANINVFVVSGDPDLYVDSYASFNCTTPNCHTYVSYAWASNGVSNEQIILDTSVVRDFIVAVHAYYALGDAEFKTMVIPYVTVTKADYLRPLPSTVITVSRNGFVRFGCEKPDDWNTTAATFAGIIIDVTSVAGDPDVHIYDSALQNHISSPSDGTKDSLLISKDTLLSLGSGTSVFDFYIYAAGNNDLVSARVTVSLYYEEELLNYNFGYLHDIAPPLQPGQTLMGTQILLQIPPDVTHLHLVNDVCNFSLWTLDYKPISASFYRVGSYGEREAWLINQGNSSYSDSYSGPLLMYTTSCDFGATTMVFGGTWAKGIEPGRHNEVLRQSELSVYRVPVSDFVTPRFIYATLETQLDNSTVVVFVGGTSFLGDCRYNDSCGSVCSSFPPKGYLSILVDTTANDCSSANCSLNMACPQHCNPATYPFGEDNTLNTPCPPNAAYFLFDIAISSSAEVSPVILTVLGGTVVADGCVSPPPHSFTDANGGSIVYKVNTYCGGDGFNIKLSNVTGDPDLYVHSIDTLGKGGYIEASHEYGADAIAIVNDGKLPVPFFIEVKAWVAASFRVTLDVLLPFDIDVHGNDTFSSRVEQEGVVIVAQLLNTQYRFAPDVEYNGLDDMAGAFSSEHGIWNSVIMSAVADSISANSSLLNLTLRSEYELEMRIAASAFVGYHDALEQANVLSEDISLVLPPQSLRVWKSHSSQVALRVTRSTSTPTTAPSPTPTTAPSPIPTAMPSSLDGNEIPVVDTGNQASEDGNNVALIGAGAGALVFLTVLVSIAWFCIARRKPKPKQEDSGVVPKIKIADERGLPERSSSSRSNRSQRTSRPRTPRSPRVHGQDEMHSPSFPVIIGGTSLELLSSLPAQDAESESRLSSVPYPIATTVTVGTRRLSTRIPRRRLSTNSVTLPSVGDFHQNKRRHSVGGSDVAFNSANVDDVRKVENGVNQLEPTADPANNKMMSYFAVTQPLGRPAPVPVAKLCQVCKVRKARIVVVNKANGSQEKRCNECHQRT